MTDTSVASDFLQSLDVQSGLSSEVTLYHVMLVDDIADLSYFFICQVSDTSIRIYIRCSENLVCTCSADSVDISQTDLYTFFSW